GIGKGHLLHQVSRRLRSGILPNLEVLFRVSLNEDNCIFHAASLARGTLRLHASDHFGRLTENRGRLA
ncbi:hypothetical protein ACIQSO_23765, partial [Pseudomonas putida]|uniref:hypothetical protein n=1 Tax=Pseudomonas putida TaxID=303 RepID=UPI00383A04C0